MLIVTYVVITLCVYMNVVSYIWRISTIRIWSLFEDRAITPRYTTMYTLIGMLYKYTRIALISIQRGVSLHEYVTCVRGEEVVDTLFHRSTVELVYDVGLRETKLLRSSSKSSN